MTQPIRPGLETRSVTKVYQMGEVEVHALRGVDVSLLEGELIVLLGVSGSGKSTLLNILGGLDVPTQGQVFYRDRELTDSDADELTSYRREHVGFVFQFYNLIPSLTARENVALVTEIANSPLDPGEALELVGLQDRLDHCSSRHARSGRSGSWRTSLACCMQRACARCQSGSRRVRVSVTPCCGVTRTRWSCDVLSISTGNVPRRPRAAY